MELTRRDAVAALFAGGGSVIPAVRDVPELVGEPSASGGVEITDDGVGVLTAVARVVYPSEVTGIGEFVDQYVRGLPPARQREIASAARALDKRARGTHGAAMSALSPTECDSVLRSMGVDRTVSSPDGSVPQRVRYHVVNQLLYGLYTSPRGSRLLGVENPIGHPGGYESYQKPPSTTSGSASVNGVGPQSDE
ncbi:gluconate 2-dehydrogenase subunit 3 family protein [Halobellus rarus]|uniref:Gluconate 2-dehydrogenase subunit 3 family protein n=1 Tax=Halobellus rarus TaxID=1126237 RepID=A0ABD6CLD3_9EURY|nr:gluconate 2-dehydrogenase subunit 3 family protein [Halobellus rarus]